MNAPKSSGALFKNDRRETDDHPLYKGNITITSEQMNALTAMLKQGKTMNLDVAAWIKQDKNGNNYMSLSAEAKPHWKEAQGGGQRAAPKDDGFGDADIPF